MKDLRDTTCWGACSIVLILKDHKRSPNGNGKSGLEQRIELLKVIFFTIRKSWEDSIIHKNVNVRSANIYEPFINIVILAKYVNWTLNQI